MSAQIIDQPRILDHFSSCTDPRTRPVQYPLLEIVLVVVLATICGEEGWEAMVEWGEDKLSFLRKLLPFDNGISSPDTLRRVIERIDPKEFLSCFIAWGSEFKERSAGQVCIDGKTLRNALLEGGPLHLVSAWCEKNRMVLGAVRTPSKSNEITAIDELLKTLVLSKGDIVTIDAIGCQRKIVAAIRKQSADYVIAVKRNQTRLAEEIENFFDQATEAGEFSECLMHTTQEDRRTRKDTHEIWVCQNVDWLPQLSEWEGLSSVAMIARSWNEKGRKRKETRYYISSLRADPERIGEIVRRHWSVENEFHWHLDVTFHEDDSHIGGQANENLRVARMTALELLRGETTFKKGLKAKARKCVRSEAYLETVLMAGNF